MSVNHERAELLMQVMKLAAEHGPNTANNIARLASLELKEMDEVAKEDLAALAEEEKAKAAEAAEVERKRQEALAAQQAASGTDEDEVGDIDPETKPKPVPKTDQTALDNMRRL